MNHPSNFDIFQQPVRKPKPAWTPTQIGIIATVSSLATIGLITAILLFIFNRRNRLKFKLYPISSSALEHPPKPPFSKPTFKFKTLGNSTRLFYLNTRRILGLGPRQVSSNHFRVSSTVNIDLAEVGAGAGASRLGEGDRGNYAPVQSNRRTNPAFGPTKIEPFDLELYPRPHNDPELERTSHSPPPQLVSSSNFLQACSIPFVEWILPSFLVSILVTSTSFDESNKNLQLRRINRRTSSWISGLRGRKPPPSRIGRQIRFIMSKTTMTKGWYS